jgi:uncharacterized protein (TIGR00730 family)
MMNENGIAKKRYLIFDPMQTIKAITIYAASSSDLPPAYIQAAKDLGKLMAVRRITCVNGGGVNGLMAAISDAVLENEGHVCGVIPQFMIDKGWLHPTIPEVIVTPDMHSRKLTMIRKSDACIALPGGVGTLEELSEVIAWKQLGLYTNPIIILNMDGFYDPLLLLFEKMQQEGFFHHNFPELLRVASTPEEALNSILTSDNFHSSST